MGLIYFLRNMRHRENRNAVPFDVTYNGQTMDLLSPLGFSNAVYHTLNLKPGSGALSAPVCSTFVMVWLDRSKTLDCFKELFCFFVPTRLKKYFYSYISLYRLRVCFVWENWGFIAQFQKLCGFPAPLPRSMGSTLRAKSNPLGRSDSEAVARGNLLASRAVILMLLAAAKGVFWCLEQPASSTMEYHPLFQALLRLVTVRRIHFRMSQFGGPTPKRTVLYSSS